MGFLSRIPLFSRIPIGDVLRPPSRKGFKIKTDKRLNVLDESPKPPLRITMRPKKMLDISRDELLALEAKLNLKKYW